jgi:hypothetical protein
MRKQMRVQSPKHQLQPITVSEQKGKRTDAHAQTNAGPVIWVPALVRHGIKGKKISCAKKHDAHAQTNAGFM